MVNGKTLKPWVTERAIENDFLEEVIQSVKMIRAG